MSFHQALGAVASERLFLEMIEAPPLEKVCAFPKDNPRHAHRGTLGMGILPEYRGRGIGTRLLTAVLEQAKRFGLEKVELNVYTSNHAGVALYQKFGFEREGLIRKYRKLDGVYFDSITMGKFL